MSFTKLISALFLILCGYNINAQSIYGKVFNSTGDLLPFSSITIKGTTKGVSANNKGKYSINTGTATITLICQHIGYQAQEKTVTVNNEDVEITFVLSNVNLSLDAVVISSNRENPALRIIRAAIKQRPTNLAEVTNLSCELYTKDLVKLAKLPKRILGQKIEMEDNERASMGLDSNGKGIIYLSESFMNVYTDKPNKYKQEILSSRVSGSNSFGFSFPSFINFYQNNVSIFTERLNPRGFISPIANSALGFYKYKYLGTFFEGNNTIHSIKLTPRRNNEPLFSGIINILDDTWRIHSVELTVTKNNQLEILDSLKITQIHAPAQGIIWRAKTQNLQFGANIFGVGLLGTFTNVYNNYNINRTYPKNFFGNVIIKYDTAVAKHTPAFWDSLRPIALEPEEVKDYQFKDSVNLAEIKRDTSQAHLDTLKKPSQKLTVSKLFWRGYYASSRTKNLSTSVYLPPLLKNIEYNPAEGVVAKLQLTYTQRNKNAKYNFTMFNNIRYGFSNTHLNAHTKLTFSKRNPQNQANSKQSFSISGGKQITEFNNNNNMPALVTSLSTLLYGKNFFKFYENWFGQLQFTKTYQTGFNFSSSLEYQNRLPINNTTNFVLLNKNKPNLQPNYPVEQLTSQFTPHKALIASFSISYQPGQQYIQFPKSKVAMGSSKPTYSLSYAKGFNNILGSSVNFDKWEVGLSHNKNLKLLGEFKYKIGAGGFLNNKQVYVQDYKHFNGNITWWASEYLNSFQLASLYQYSNKNNFYTFGHVQHHFNGLLTNKIPLLNKLKWNLVVASNAFYVSKTNNYVEVSAGLENILKVLRVDFVTAYATDSNLQSGVRVGFGGLIGGGLSTSNSNGQQQISITF
jgi:hypothetical protein